MTVSMQLTAHNQNDPAEKVARKKRKTSEAAVQTEPEELQQSSDTESNLWGMSLISSPSLPRPSPPEVENVEP